MTTQSEIATQPSAARPVRSGASNGASNDTMGKISILKEFWQFLRERKKWWLTPVAVVLMLLGALIVFSQGSAVAPFIYTLF